MHKQLIMIGPTRTGTTSLFRFLGGDQRIALSTRKETNYFYNIYSGIGLNKASYLSNFANLSGKTYSLEASPLYFMGGEQMARSIKRTLGEVRAIIILRNPVDRFISLFLHIRDKRNIGAPIDFEEFAQHCLSFARQDFCGLSHVNSMSYLEGCYSTLLPEWISELGAENIFLIFYDSLRDEETQAAELRRLFDWLELSDSPLLDRQLPVENASRAPPVGTTVHKFALKLNDSFETYLNRHNAVRSMLRKLYYSLGESKQSRSALASETVRILEVSYKAANRELASQLETLYPAEKPEWVLRGY